MNPNLAGALQWCRDHYDYPWAAIALSFNNGIQVAPGKYLQFDDRASRVTDSCLDLHQFILLHAPVPDPLAAWAGCGSVIYWGFSTYGQNYACARAVRFLYGGGAQNAGAPPAIVNATAAAVEQATRSCFNHDWGMVLDDIGQLRELGQLPFASKVVAFLSPKYAGVYDNRINNFLLRTGLDTPLLGCPAVPVNGRGIMQYARTSSPRNQAVYQRWCKRLRQLRDALRGLGPNYAWRCTERRPQGWRAVDVERALFRLSRLWVPKPSSPGQKNKGQGRRQSGYVGSSARPGFDGGDVVDWLRKYCESHPIS